MPTRNISLTDEQDAFVERVVKAGEYQNASEAVRDALRVLQQRRRVLLEELTTADDQYTRTEGHHLRNMEPQMKRFAGLFQGTWQLAPDPSGLKVTIIGEGVAQLFVPIVFTIGNAGQPAQTTTFLMNQVLRKTADGWKVSSVLPIPVPKQ